MTEEEALEALDDAIMETIRSLRRGDEQPSITIREEDERPLDEDDVWAGQMFWAREEECEDCIAYENGDSGNVCWCLESGRG
jgi:hypothetical protein